MTTLSSVQNNLIAHFQSLRALPGIDPVVLKDACAVLPKSADLPTTIGVAGMFKARLGAEWTANMAEALALDFLRREYPSEQGSFFSEIDEISQMPVPADRYQAAHGWNVLARESRKTSPRLAAVQHYLSAELCLMTIWECKTSGWPETFREKRSNYGGLAVYSFLRSALSYFEQGKREPKDPRWKEAAGDAVVDCLAVPHDLLRASGKEHLRLAEKASRHFADAAAQYVLRQPFDGWEIRAAEAMGKIMTLDRARSPDL